MMIMMYEEWDGNGTGNGDGNGKRNGNRDRDRYEGVKVKPASALVVSCFPSGKERK